MDASQLSFFGYGALLGLAVACWVAFSAWRKRRDLALEVSRLRRHLHDQMEISHEGAEQRKHELERLRKENENLRIAVKSWQQKPDRRELRQLQVYDRAVREISASAPGFSAHWENALKDAELEVEQMDRGLLAFARRLVQPAKRSMPPREE
jgi:hypothetical protein